MNVCVCNEELALGRQVYGEMCAAGLRPHLHAFNSLINAYARTFRLGDVVRCPAARFVCGSKRGLGMYYPFLLTLISWSNAGGPRAQALPNIRASSKPCAAETLLTKG